MPRRRKPISQHKLEGTFRPARHESRMREPQFDDKPRRPRGMSKDAQALWDKLVPALAAKGIATAIDSPALECMCEAWSEYLAAKRLRPNTLDDKARHQRMVNSCRRAFVELASKFGLTPSDRTRLEVAEGVDETNPFEMLLADQPILKIEDGRA